MSKQKSEDEPLDEADLKILDDALKDEEEFFNEESEACGD